MRSTHWNWMDITFLGVTGAMICLDYVLKKRLERRPKPFPTMPLSNYIPIDYKSFNPPIPEKITGHEHCSPGITYKEGSFTLTCKKCLSSLQTNHPK